jgi:hypothetical protein
MRKHLIALLVITPLLLSSQLSTSHAATKAGAKCQKVGVKSVVGVKTFTCIKSGKKLVWNKGVVVKKATPTPIPKGVTAALQSFGQFPKSKDVPQKVSFNFGPNADKDISALIVKAANGIMELFVDFYQDPRPYPVFFGSPSDTEWIIQEWTKISPSSPSQEEGIRRWSQSPNQVLFTHNRWGSPQGDVTFVTSQKLLSNRTYHFSGDWSQSHQDAERKHLLVAYTHHIMHGIQSRITGGQFQQLGCWGTEGGAQFYGGLTASRILDLDYLENRNHQLSSWTQNLTKGEDLRRYNESQWFDILKKIECVPGSNFLESQALFRAETGMLQYSTGVLLYERLMEEFGHQKIMEWWYGLSNENQCTSRPDLKGVCWKAPFQRTFGVDVDSWYRNSAIPYLIGEYQSWIPPSWWRGVG